MRGSYRLLLGTQGDGEELSAGWGRAGNGRPPMTGCPESTQVTPAKRTGPGALPFPGKRQ